MKPRWRILCLPLLLVCGFAAMAQSQTPVANRKKVIEDARHAYYSLRAAGLDEFRATVKPNWELVLKDQLKSDPVSAQAGLKLLNGLHFSMLLDRSDKVTVAHHTDTAPINEQQRQGFDQIYSGMDQAINGFFTTWELFMLNSPFPTADSDYQLEDMGTQYRLSYKDGSSDVVTMLGKNLIITDIKVNSAEFVSSVRPQFVHTPKGFVLTGYDADYKPTSGPGVVKLTLKIDHAPVSGLQLPTSLVMDSVMDGAPTHMELAFSEFEVKSH
ncbi:MAG TPA: hypothetical protein VN658_00910 [Candidatus Acidoferrales bacterium]|nr:hypothetical protein [Candidatus Acidoferrales bacterium]